ncbi:MAG: GAF domain-containing protein [Anaerolineales bacterium]|nr:GAF domain-containing protein [Anaerolineales bacterium]
MIDPTFTRLQTHLAQLVTQIPELSSSDLWSNILQDLEVLSHSPTLQNISNPVSWPNPDDITTQMLLEHANTIILRLDTAGRITYLNEFAQTFFGYSAAEIIGQDAVGTIVPAASADLIRRIVTDPDKYSSHENENLRRSGERVWVAWSNKSILDEQGQLKEVLCIGSDITAHRHTEQELLHQKELLSRIIDALPVGIFAKDVQADYRFTVWNKKIEEIFEIEREKILGRNDYDFFDAADADYIHLTDEAVMKEGEVMDIPQEEITTNHGEILAHTIKVPIYDSAGSPQTLLGILEDITLSSRIKAELQESQERLSEAHQIAKLGTWSWDLTNNKAVWNRRTREIFGIHPQVEIDFDLFTMLLHPDDRDRVLKTIQKTLESASDRYEIEHRLLRENGDTRHIHTIGRIKRLEDGRPAEIVGVTQDITERKEAQHALQQAEEKYRSIYENAVEGIFQTSLDGRYISANLALARIYGYPSPQALMKNLTDIKHQLYVDPIRRDEFIDIVKEKGHISEFESQVYRREGTVIWISENARAVYHANGDLVYFEGTVIDITKRKQAEQQILQRNAELAAINRVATAITSAAHPKDGFKIVAQEMLQLFGACRSGIAMLTADKQNLQVVSDFAINQETEAYGDLIPLKNNYSSNYVIETGQSIVIDDAPTNPKTTAVHNLIKRLQIECLLIVPLITHGQVIGTLGVAFDKPGRTFEPHEVKLAETIANQIAGALDNAQLLDQTQAALIEQQKAEEGLLQALQKTESLYRIGDAMATSSDEGSTFETVLGEYLRLLNVKSGKLALRNRAKDQNEIRALYINGQPASIDPTVSMGGDLFHYLVEQSKPLVIGNVFTHPLTRDNDILREMMQVKSMLYLPIVLRSQTIGVIAAGSQLENRDFSPSDIELGQVIADQLAIWLDNRRLLAEAQYRSDRLQTAAEVSRAASSILDVGDLITTSVNLIQNQFGFYYVGLFLVDEVGQWAVLQAGTGEAGRIQLRQNHKLKVGEESMIGWSIYHRQARIALDVGQDAVRFKNPVLPDTRSEMALPLISREEVMGALTVQSTERGAFSAEDITLLQTMADQLANAITNAHLFERAAQARREAETRLRETIALQRLGQSLSGTLNLNEIFSLFFETCMREIGFDYIMLSMVDSGQQRIKAISGVGISDNNIKQSDRALDDKDIMADIIKTGKTEVITGWDERYDRTMYEAEGHANWVRVFTPIVLRQENIGLVEAGFKNPDTSIEDAHLRLLKAFITQMALSLDNAQLFRQTQEALASTQQLFRISSSLVESVSIDDIFNIVLDNVKIFGVDRVSLSLLDKFKEGQPESVTIVSTWDRDPSRNIPVGTNFSASDYKLVQSFAHPPFTPLISQDLRQPEQDERMDEEFRQFALNELQTITLFSAPMFLGTEYKGVLSIYTRQPHHYTEQEKLIYQTLADQAIIALENHRLLETTKNERDRAALLYQLGQRLSSTTSVETVQQIILEFTERMGASHAEIFITDGGAFLSVATSIAERQNVPLVDLVRLALLEGPEALALDRGERITLTRSDQQPWLLDEIAGMPVVNTVTCVPFYSQRSILHGVLTFLHPQTNGFTEEQLATFDSLAIQTAATLENVWLLEQTNQVLKETELLYKASRRFNTAQFPEDLLNIMVDSFADTTNTNCMCMALVAGMDETGQPKGFKIIAKWSQKNPEILSTSIHLSPDKFTFIQDLRYDAPLEINLDNLDAASQASLQVLSTGVHAILAVPLAVGRNWLGVFLFGSKSNRYELNSNIINQITSLAGQAAVVIQNLQLVAETQQNLYNSEILSSLVQQLLKAETIGAMYEMAVSAIAATEPDRGVSIFMYEPIEDSIDLELVALWDNPRQEWPSIPVGSHLSTSELGLEPLLKTGQTVFSNDITKDERFSPMLKQLLTVMHIKTMVAVPIWLNKSVEGFILISNHVDLPFASDMIRLYESIARETSGALENRRLLDETQHRAHQLQTAAEVSQAATANLDLEALLFEAVDLIKQRFDFYHVSIFLTDEYDKHAVVKASTGEIGQKMLVMKHKLEVGGKSIVGTATATGEPCIALDVGSNAVHFNNPLVPNTRSEMALPLIAQGRIIGALDVQSTKRNAFDQSDITILQSMANQLSNAIRAAQAVQELNQALEEVNKMHRHYIENQWTTYIREQRATTNYRVTDRGITIEKDQEILPGVTQAFVEKKPIIIPATRSTETDSQSDSSSQRPANGKNNQDSSKWTRPLPEKTSTLVAPLTLKGQAVLGTIDFELPKSTLDAIWEDDTLKIIEAVTSQAAQAIESARLFEQTQVAREEAEALYQVGRLLVTTEDEREMFNTVLSKMLTTLGLKQGGILLFEEDFEYGKLHALFENGKPVMKPRLRIPIKDNPSYQRLIETKQPIAIEDVATDPLVATVREINIPRGIISLLLVPIVINDQVAGAIGADSVGKRHIFTESEINLAMAMADQLSIALQNHRLIEETKRRAILLQTSADVGRVATSILDPSSMVNQAVELIKERFGFYHVQIFLVDEAEQYAVLHKSTGEAGRRLLEMNYKVAIGSQSVIGQVTDQRKPIVTRSTDFDSKKMVAYQRNELLSETQAELAIPLQVGDRLVGVLDVQSTLPQAFSEEESSTLGVLAAQLAVAIENARAFQEQQKTAERLKEIDKLKTQFLANMSHELRTPLNSIIGFSRVILKGIDGPLTELQKTDLTSIHNSGQHLLGLINNILDLSKIEAGKMELNFEQTEIEPIIKTVMSTALALIKDKPVTLRQEVPENLPLIWADPTRIRQVVLNLVSNACKFTEEGTVITRVTIEDDRVIFSVTDTGIGIPPAKLSTIFEEFTQVDASTTRKAGGTGLGLPISRHFVEMHKGKIWVNSIPGKGSTFSFYIPIKPIKAELPAPDNIASLTREDEQPTEKLVAVIDDDPGVIALYKRFLEKQHYHVLGLDHNRNVVTQIVELSPFAVLLDVILPDKDGWNVLKELKENATTKDIPILVCSIASDKNRGFSLGATNYLIKPIVEDELIEALSYIDQKQSGEINVLIVDDKADDILLTRRMLEAQGNYSISEAYNGKEGLELIKRKKPDLIILDLNMPEMDGFTMIEELKANENTRSIPIIIVSGEQVTPEQRDKLTDQVEVLLEKSIFTENELLEDVSQALARLRQEEKKRSRSEILQ